MEQPKYGWCNTSGKCKIIMRYSFFWLVILLNFMNMPTISNSTFLSHQRHHLFPSIMNVWEDQRAENIEKVKRSQKPLCVGGDGRYDTPGHSAKYGFYSLMYLDSGTLLTFELVQSNEVKNSVHMEKEGLIRFVDFLDENGIKIDTIITDRHVMIRKWVRENLKDTRHRIDVWHVAKGLKKKILALSKEKECEASQEWIKSIINHLYWVPASTPSADGALMYAKWISLINHVQNIHEGHGDLFPKCLHDDLSTRPRKKKWLQPETKCMEKLEYLLTSQQMKKDIPMMSTKQQISELEGYHSVVNQFAPKMHGFSYHGMKGRLLLAAMHYNENGRCSKATSIKGHSIYKITYPKQKKRDYTVREVKEAATYGYVQILTERVLKTVESTSLKQAKKDILTVTPPALCSSFVRPMKEDAVRRLDYRFNHDQHN